MQQDPSRGVRVPPELHGVQPRPLEEYVRARLLQFAQALAGRISPALSPQMVQSAAFDALQSLPPPDYGGLPLEQRDLQLVFRHDCLSLGCLDAQCVLCEHNPHRRCSVNFAPKYLVNDLLKAKCDAPIRVEVIDRTTGQPVPESISDVQLEMCVLDGNLYDAKVAEAGEEREDDLDAAVLPLNNKASPLLAAGPGAAHTPASKVLVPLSKGAAALPELHVTDSSEAMLSGRKPPFRLLVRAVRAGQALPNIRHCVSEGFVVATRRTRTAGKVEIPNVDDHVSKLEHMGKETVKKLQDIRGSASQAGIDIIVPDNTINKVGEFRKLALLAEADGHLRQKLQQVLKLSKEKWDEARDHALKAVVADNRMRIWYADKQNMEVGLLFTCRLGNVDLERPVGLLTKKSQEGAQTTMEATLMAQQTPAQRDQVRMLQPQAVAAWWQPGHPGWAIYPVDSEQFMSTGALESVSLPTPDHLHAASPMVPPSPTALPGAVAGGPGGLPPPPFSPALAGAFGLGPMPGGDAMLRALGGFMPGAGPPNPLLAQQLGMGVPQGLLAGAGEGPADAGGKEPSQLPGPAIGQGFAAAAAGPGGLGGMPEGGSMSAQPAVTSPFAALPPGMGPGGPKLGLPPLDPSFSIGQLTSLFGGDLARLPQLAGQLAGFPSIPHGAISADLEQLLQQHAAAAAAAGGGSPGTEGEQLGAGAMRVPSFNLIGKMESMELPGAPDAAAMAAAMMQDMGPESALQRAMATSGPGTVVVQELGRGGLGQRGPSMGLETMQSIEQALDNLEEHANGEDGRASPPSPTTAAAAAADGVGAGRREPAEGPAAQEGPPSPDQPAADEPAAPAAPAAGVKQEAPDRLARQQLQQPQQPLRTVGRPPLAGKKRK